MDTSWEEVSGVFQTISSFSRITQGHSPLQIDKVLNQSNNASSSFGELRHSRKSYCNGPYSRTLLKDSDSSSNESIPGSLRANSRPKGFGRGKILQNLEKKYNTVTALEQMDTNIHSELREIGCGYSNEAIERNWGYSYSSNDCSQFEHHISDDVENEKSKISNEIRVMEENNNERSNTKEVIDIEGHLKQLHIQDQEDTPQHLTEEFSEDFPLEISQDVSKEISQEVSQDVPREIIKEVSKNSKHKRNRKCRNFIVDMFQMSGPTTNRRLSNTVLKGPDSFLQPQKKYSSNKHSYSAALGSKDNVGLHLDKQGDSIFSSDDFPAL